MASGGAHRSPLPSQPQRQWPQRLLRAFWMGLRETLVIVVVIFVAAFAITEIGTAVVSRPGAPAAVVLPELWPIVRWLAPFMFVTTVLKTLVKEPTRL